MSATALRRALALPTSTLLALAVALGLLTTTAPAAEAGPAERRERQVATAMSVVKAQKGDPYGYGAAGPDRFDCSGLIYYAFRKAGFSVPRTSREQAASLGRRIPQSQVRRGDLVFFADGGDVYHAGVFAGWKGGHGYLVHASKPGTDVKRDRIWTTGWFARSLR